jgi:hypothetical protein
MRKTVLFFLSITTLSVTAQKKWYSFTKNDVAIYSGMAISGTADGFNQAIVHHEFGINRPFTDYATSWQRKYKDEPHGDYSRAYIGSKSWLVWTTDAFHLTRAIDHLSMATSILIASGDLKHYAKKDRWKVLLIKKGLIPIILRGMFFDIFFNNLGYHK